jgi:Fe-S oxidoreductase
MMPLMKTFGGVAPQRTLPRFADKTFREQYVAAAVSAAGSPRSTEATQKRVLLWPDTFNNHFHPETALAAVEVLGRAGYAVTIPRKRLCCGRPLYDWGFLDRAKKLLRETMNELRSELAEGVPIVGLEPSCVSVFRDELPGLFPNEPLARQLAKSTLTLSEFLMKENVELPALNRKAIVQAHCHHKAVMKFDPEEALLRKIGLDLEHPDSGCCGMAGAFGFEARHYDISMRAGERVILPLVREAPADTLIIANGFSCREQITQATGRETLHLAEVLKMAMEGR